MTLLIERFQEWDSWLRGQGIFFSENCCIFFFSFEWKYFDFTTQLEAMEIEILFQPRQAVVDNSAPIA